MRVDQILIISIGFILLNLIGHMFMTRVVLTGENVDNSLNNKYFLGILHLPPLAFMFSLFLVLFGILIKILRKKKTE